MSDVILDPVEYDEPMVLWHRLANEPCDCGGIGVHIVIPATSDKPSNAFGRIICTTSGCYRGWAPKPRVAEETKKRRRRSRRLGLTSDDCCFWCGRNASVLELFSLTLEAAHVTDRAVLVDLGLPPDSPGGQLPMCTECHAKRHRMHEQTRRTLDALAAAGVELPPQSTSPLVVRPWTEDAA